MPARVPVDNHVVGALPRVAKPTRKDRVLVAMIVCSMGFAGLLAGCLMLLLIWVSLELIQAIIRSLRALFG